MSRLKSAEQSHNPQQKQQQEELGSHPEMVGDMSRVTLNFDLSKIPFMHF